MNIRLDRRFLVVATLVVATVVGCKGSVTPIKTMLDDPSLYDKHVVRIAGTVSKSAGVFGYGAYEVDDGTGSIPVVSDKGGAPREGARVGIEGEFRSAFTLGTQSGAVILERRRFTP